MSSLPVRNDVPWYREPWPWFLMLGPLFVVVAGSYAAWLAVSGADGVVASDYYTQGLNINRQLARDAAAQAQGLSATAQIAAGNLRIVLAQAKATSVAPAPELRLVMVHATQSGVDRSLPLARQADGSYAGDASGLAAGNWNVALEGRDWRLTGRWRTPAPGVMELRPNG